MSESLGVEELQVDERLPERLPLTALSQEKVHIVQPSEPVLCAESKLVLLRLTVQGNFQANTDLDIIDRGTVHPG